MTRRRGTGSGGRIGMNKSSSSGPHGKREPKAHAMNVASDVADEYIAVDYDIFEKPRADFVQTVRETARIARRALMRLALVGPEEHRQEILAALAQHTNLDKEWAIVRDALANGTSIFWDLKRKAS
jgi:hypothetical protein